jgi:hypothetical protein
MTPELSTFSDWTLALLPRLFLYPGGLWLLAALLLVRFASSGIRSVSLGVMASDLGRANLLSVAVAWACVAVMPFPGAPALPSGVDALALAWLPALSMLIDISAVSPARALVACAITLALLLPAVEGGSLLASSEGSAFVLVASSLAVVAGLLALSLLGHAGIASETRWVAWFCLGVVPIWQKVAGDSIWATGLFVLVGVLAINGATRLPSISSSKAGQREPAGPGWWRRPAGLAMASAWLLALAGLLWALPAA